ncbi:EF-hand domain-containing family member C2 [Trichonephila clavipes]|nr:EF-hand domain-containing family member C2 [Trichonephila clavipes]
MASDFKLSVPGFSSDFTSYESKHHKPQRFVYRKGLTFEEFEDDKLPKVSRATRLLGNNMFNINTAPVLTFKAYYRDPVGEGFKSTTRFRECNVLYFLDDDEMKIYEPPQLNSGLQQGRSRDYYSTIGPSLPHAVDFDAGDWRGNFAGHHTVCLTKGGCIVGKGKFIKPEGGFYTIDDLNINETIFVNGRQFKLINCDPFTRKFLTEMGYRVPSPQPDVYDPITEDRKEMNKLRSYRKPVAKQFKGASFFKNHPRRLRFFGTFGDSKNLFEEERQCILYYDLADGTIKIVEERHSNKWIGGRSDTPVLLRPTLVPKSLECWRPLNVANPLSIRKKEKRWAIFWKLFLLAEVLFLFAVGVVPELDTSHLFQHNTLDDDDPRGTARSFVVT